MESSGEKNRAVLPLIFFASLASLSYEITLMRVFSISLWYHFAFMVISIAMLGIAASGTMLSVFSALKDIKRVPAYALLLAAGIPASYLLANAVPFDPARLSWDRTQLLLVGLYYVILAAPFFCFGLIVSTAYSAMSVQANAVYASDLVGAGAGSLAVFWLLSMGGPEKAVFIVSSLLATGLLSLGSRKMQALALLLLASNMTLLFIHPQFIQPRISPYKPFELAMKFPGAERLGTAYSPYARVDLFKSPAVRFAPGLSLRYLDPLPGQTGIAIDAGEVHAITNEGEGKKLGFVRYLPSSLGYRLGRNEDVLIIEPRGGLAVLMAKQFDARTIFAVDSNPLVVDIVQEYGREYATGIRKEHSFAGLGRTWLAASGRTFDLTDLSLMSSFPAAAFGFSEDYRFTKEAFTEYLSHLKPDGVLSLNLYIIPPPRTELRLLATLVQAAEGLGMKDISRHIAAIRSWDTLTLLVKRSELTAEDIGRIKDFTRETRFDLVYYPGIRPEESNVFIKTPSNEYFTAFQRLMDPALREQFIDGYLFDIRPVTDERPFFHYYLKLKNIRAIYRLMGEKWQYFFEEGYLLPLIFVQVLVISVVLIFLPLVRIKREKKNTEDISRKAAKLAKKRGRDALFPLAYFAFLGMAFLFVELAFIQKMVLALENPAYAAGAVITPMLISSGIGSLVSYRVRELRSHRTILVLAGLVLAYSAALLAIISAISHFPLSTRVILAAFSVMPAGLLMGIPFPLGIATLGKTTPSLIPWAWAVNGCFSVLSPVLATMLALSVGFRTVLIAGAGMYLLAYGVMRRRWGTDME
jgi:hypothetical protein